MWTFQADLPVLETVPTCCDAAMGYRCWRFRHVDADPHPWRCDVTLECATCYRQQQHSVRVTAGQYHGRGTRTVVWGPTTASSPVPAAGETPGDGPNAHGEEE